MSPLNPWLAVAITLLFWSSSFAGIRAGLSGGYSPGSLVLLRYLSASAFFIIYALFAKKPFRIPNKKDFLKIFLLGFIGISVYHTSLAFGEKTVSAGTASLLIGAAPVFTAIIAAFILKEKILPIGWVGLLIGFAGISLITFGARETSIEISKGALLVLLSAVSTSIFFVFQKPLFKKYSSIELTAYFTWAGTIPMLVFLPRLFLDMQHASAPATLATVYIGVFPAAIGYVTWAVALSKVNASSVTSSLYIQPVLAIFIAWIWLGELPEWLSIIGGVIAISGVIVVNVFGMRRPSNHKSLT